MGEAASEDELAAFFNVTPHATFEWSAAEGVSDRGAMRVPVDLGDISGWLQLDTGLDVTLIYGSLTTDADWEECDGAYRVPSLTIGDMSLGPTWVRADRGMSAGGGLLGSIGLDLLVGHAVIIDYPGQRFALASLGDIPGGLLRRVSWTPATLRDGKLFPHVIVNGQYLGDMFFDTGSSALDVVVDLETWTTLTGVSSPDSAAIHWTAGSWGDAVTLVGQPALGPLVVGAAKVERPNVFYMAEQPRLFESWPFPATGLIGNAAFFDRVVVLDLGLRPRFGLLEGGARPD